MPNNCFQAAERYARGQGTPSFDGKYTSPSPQNPIPELVQTS